MTASEPQQTVGSMSERQLLASFTPILSEHNDRVNARGGSRLKLGPGDDCAAIDLNGGQTVITCDTLTEGFDFRTRWPSGYRTTGFDLGYKAATQNLADVASMGAEPMTIVVSVSLPAQTPAQWLPDFARGLVTSCNDQQAWHCTISGGDLGGSKELSITVTAVGLCTTAPVTRSGAGVSDVVAVSGRLGWAAAGLSLLDSTDYDPSDPAISSLITAQTRPAGAMRAGISAASCATAMMDVSDGLVRDAQRIAAASRVSIDLDTQALARRAEKLLPAAEMLAGPASAFDTALTWVLSGGEDHAMLACFAPGHVPEGFEVVGLCTSTSGSHEVTVDGKEPAALGWDHFGA
ncbi:thiamine-phosphate kinase [Rothia sp. LK2588]|uniref:thiamine-phosphate kinase n=1 Tax=Rothia sp. LK2588 TaxID=3114369 RepID=UPI0034CD2BBA